MDAFQGAFNFKDYSMDFFRQYTLKLNNLLVEYNWEKVYTLAEDIRSVWQRNGQVFLCGNGGSAANALHLSNDLVFGASPFNEKGIKAHALSSNLSVITCIANDISYEDIFAYQLGVLGNAGDLLIVMSGSGNSPNIIKAIEKAKKMNIKTYGIFGYSGGKGLHLVDIAIHFPIDDMQIAEDCQQIVGHMVMRWLKEKPFDEIMGGR